MPATSRAGRLLDLHRRPHLLLLPNAWDRAGARLLARMEGVAAIGTTSAGIAAAHGLPDGERLGREEMLAAIAAIVEAVPLPVTADLEAGYGDAAATVRMAADAGAAGANLEDGEPGGPGLVPAGRHAEAIAAAREAVGRPFVINARTDTWWRGIGAPSARMDETLSRLSAYRDAGADCVFVPGFPAAGVGSAGAEAQIAELTAALGDLPLNLLASPALPAPPRLAELGVRRLSLGSGLYRLALAAVREAMTGLLRDGDLGVLAPAAGLSYSELAGLLGDDR